MIKTNCQNTAGVESHQSIQWRWHIFHNFIIPLNWNTKSIINFFLVAGAVGGDGEGDGDDKEKAEEEERERLEAIKEAEDRRKEKHRKMEEEREKMRQDIRDKVSLLFLYLLT